MAFGGVAFHTFTSYRSTRYDAAYRGERPWSMLPSTQQVRFCTSRDGTRIAYAISGAGPALLRAPHWMSSINLESDSQVWSHWNALLERHRTVIRFDQRGCGLSDRDGLEFSFERFVEDFEAVIEAAGLDRFDLFGFSGGAMTGVTYAARFPHRVDRFIIHSSTAYGPLSAPASDRFRQTAATQLEAIELGWPNENPAFRQLFTSMLIPDGTAEQFRLFNEQIRVTTPPANGRRIIEAFWNADIRAEASNLRCPTLVLHSRQDGRIPFEQGRELAGLIPTARFVPLESRNHLIFETESAWKQVTEAISGFLAVTSGRSTALIADELTSREREVLELVARGLTNVELSTRLKISEKTVRNHVSIILGKLGAVSRAQAVAIARDAGFGRRTAP
ncbi:pimeloyl-ACP methyl ester carboxylesterase/DNA-binding CsgD family transcriptional regulator [Bradyrhizobium sp. USDA 4341]